MKEEKEQKTQEKEVLPCPPSRLGNQEECDCGSANNE